MKKKALQLLAEQRAFKLITKHGFYRDFRPEGVIYNRKEVLRTFRQCLKCFDPVREVRELV